MAEEDWESPFVLGVTPQQNIKVFGHDGRLDFVSDGQGFIEGYELEGPEGEAFNPRQMTLHDEGYTALFLTPKKRNVVVSYDVETGEKLGDFSVATNKDANPMRVESLTPSRKWDNLKQQNVFDLIAVGGRSMARLQWDQREKLKGNLLVPRDAEGTKTYSRVQFTSAVASKDGGLAVGDTKGTVRLFKDPTQVKMMDSKTNYEQYSLGEPVVGMDVTGDGKWVMWTTKTTIHLVDVTMEGGKNAFETRAGGAKKEVLRIQLSPSELAAMGISADEVDFTAAKFDHNALYGNPEAVIASSTGPFVLSWNLRHVLADYRKGHWQPFAEGRQRRVRTVRREARILTEAFEFGQRSDVLVGALSDRLERFSLGGSDNAQLVGSMQRGEGSSVGSAQCQARTKKGAQCSRNALSGDVYCYQHSKGV